MSVSEHKLSRRAFGGAVGAGAAAAVAGVPAPAAHAASGAPVNAAEQPFRAAPGRRSRRPNILFVFGDDLGWADLSCYGSPHIKTPHLDELAAQGVRFTDAYAGSSTCSPTRISLYTGRYPGRVRAGLEEPIGDGSVGLEPGHPTLASLLRDAGYTTAMIGKWHCGSLPDHSPTKSGWDEFFGNFTGALEYYSKLTMDGSYDLYEGETPYEDLRYYTRILTERASEFLARDHTRPWLLNLNFTTPHWPWIAEGDTQEAARLEKLMRELPPEQSRYVLAHFDGGTLDTYRQLVEDMDRSVGELVRQLEKSGQAADTLVVFCSDNGGERFSGSWPLTGMKSTLQEGGIRVPNVLRWPARIDGGQVSGVPVVTHDWTATLLEVAGAPPDPAAPLDGASLAGYLLRGEDAPRRDLFWRLRTERALRRGKWKYHRAATAKLPPNHGKDVLFDLERDPGECADRSAHEPGLLAELKSAWEQVNATLLPYPDPA
ncbi:twin-arginine translocation pathway signal protein [Streptomyces armeniacus]|uniref:Twin-arginine translocation pathway signal protein n=1 Tax=Streptomyces armeniacus TaxID=83291 RepID=A0A345XJL9_9ACTN|nr:sulfatase-like hydrolase/transferase [Streptomyces armeniacus]AXK31835.1 twin-arginine translocation pathway signal protein [Streptomyces armeniacus]